MDLENKNLQQKLVVQATIKDIWLVGKELGFVVERQEFEDKCQTDFPDLHRFVTGIKAAATELGVSPSTISRRKKSGEYDDCIFQDGKIVIFDTHKMLEKMRTSNQKGKYGNLKSNKEICGIWKKK